MQNRTPLPRKDHPQVLPEHGHHLAPTFGGTGYRLFFWPRGRRGRGVWKKVVSALEKLKVPAPQIANLVKSDNPTLVANLLQELLSKKG